MAHQRRDNIIELAPTKGPGSANILEVVIEYRKEQVLALVDTSEHPRGWNIRQSTTFTCREIEEGLSDEGKTPLGVAAFLRQVARLLPQGISIQPDGIVVKGVPQAKRSAVSAIIMALIAFLVEPEAQIIAVKHPVSGMTEAQLAEVVKLIQDLGISEKRFSAESFPGVRTTTTAPVTGVDAKRQRRDRQQGRSTRGC